MLDAFTCATFAERLGDNFVLHVNTETSLDLQLTEATTLAERGATGNTNRARTPFSIVFRGPPTPILLQRIYRFEHSAIGSFDLFLVPIGPDGRGMRYEAIFT